MERDSLILYAKTEALFFQVYPSFKNYPKAEKFSLCAHIKQCFVDLLERLGLAKMVPSKRKVALQEAAGYMNNLVTLFRLSRSERYISAGFFEQIDLKITEIKKILVGFMKSTGNRPRQTP